ncbi:ATP-binding protein [Streptomyces decoyicus]
MTHSCPPAVHRRHHAPGEFRSSADQSSGHRVYFTTAAELAAKCHKAALEGSWKTCMHFFAGPKLLIIDELGYLPLPEDGASALVQVINQRYRKCSTILTTNIGTAVWAGAFGDARPAPAPSRGRQHRRPSYRLRGHQSQTDTMRKGVNARVSGHPRRQPARPETNQLPFPQRRVHFEPEVDPLLSPLQECRPPTRFRRLGCPHLPGLRGRLHREPPPPADLLFTDCRRASERQRNRMRDEERAQRLGEHPRTLSPVPQASAPGTVDPLAPTAVRNCPHGDQPVTIVALLATPEAARPTITNRVTEVAPLRRLQ